MSTTIIVITIIKVIYTTSHQDQNTGRRTEQMSLACCRRSGELNDARARIQMTDRVFHDWFAALPMIAVTSPTTRLPHPCYPSNDRPSSTSSTGGNEFESMVAAMDALRTTLFSQSDRINALEADNEKLESDLSLTNSEKERNEMTRAKLAIECSMLKEQLEKTKEKLESIERENETMAERLADTESKLKKYVEVTSAAGSEVGELSNGTTDRKKTGRGSANVGSVSFLSKQASDKHNNVPRTQATNDSGVGSLPAVSVRNRKISLAAPPSTVRQLRESPRRASDTVVPVTNRRQRLTMIDGLSTPPAQGGGSNADKQSTAAKKESTSISSQRSAISTYSPAMSTTGGNSR